jgi:hypothetical protein
MNDLVHKEMTIGFPDGWEDRTELLIAGPPRDKRNPTVTVRRIELKFDMTLDKFVGFQAQALEVLLGVKKRNIVEEGETTLAGLPAYMRLYRFTYADKPCVQRQYYALRGRTAFVVTTTTAPDHYKDDAPVFDEIIKRFKLAAPAD